MLRIYSTIYSNGYIQSRHFSSEARQCRARSFRSSGVILAGRPFKHAASNIATAIVSMITTAG